VGELAEGGGAGGGVGGAVADRCLWGTGRDAH